ncbi:hypothetical protein PIB30_070604 [Stylosanthes scabra]|uniref:Uncharacterized protein n=1 Tax=Stylosanthes scabra TaxID=79078 RepID=A0ABU6SQG9_9FABA|nr:hypothetical protein [Stylosanthes scabra]
MAYPHDACVIDGKRATRVNHTSIGALDQKLSRSEIGVSGGRIDTNQFFNQLFSNSLSFDRGREEVPNLFYTVVVKNHGAHRAEAEAIGGRGVQGERERSRWILPIEPEEVEELGEAAGRGEKGAIGLIA